MIEVGTLSIHIDYYVIFIKDLILKRTLLNELELTALIITRIMKMNQYVFFSN